VVGDSVLLVCDAASRRPQLFEVPIQFGRSNHLDRKCVILRLWKPCVSGERHGLNSNLPETSIFLFRSNCYKIMVLSVQANVTSCEVIFMSKTKPPSEDLDSDTVQSGVSLHTFHAGCGPIRSIVAVWLTRTAKILAKFIPVPSRIQRGFLCYRKRILRKQKSRCHTETFNAYIRVSIVTTYRNPSWKESLKPGKSDPIFRGDRGYFLQRLVEICSATHGDAYLIGTLTYYSGRKTAGAWNWRIESQYWD